MRLMVMRDLFKKYPLPPMMTHNTMMKARLTRINHFGILRKLTRNNPIKIRKITTAPMNTQVCGRIPKLKAMVKEIILMIKKINKKKRSIVLV